MFIATVRKRPGYHWSRGPVLNPENQFDHEDLHATDIFVPYWPNGLVVSEAELARLDPSTWPTEMEIESGLGCKECCARMIQRVIVVAAVQNQKRRL